jgi:hypothetical protein
MDSVVPSGLDASLGVHRMPHRIPLYSANEFFSGALQIGVFVSHVLFGVTTTQTYVHYSRFPDDSNQGFGEYKAKPVGK